MLLPQRWLNPLYARHLASLHLQITLRYQCTLLQIDVNRKPDYYFKAQLAGFNALYMLRQIIRPALYRYRRILLYAESMPAIYSVLKNIFAFFNVLYLRIGIISAKMRKRDNETSLVAMAYALYGTTQ